MLFSNVHVDAVIFYVIMFPLSGLIWSTYFMSPELSKINLNTEDQLSCTNLHKNNTGQLYKKGKDTGNLNIPTSRKFF
jgi:hypothetical protein